MPPVVSKLSRRFDPKAMARLDLVVGSDDAALPSPGVTNERPMLRTAFGSSQVGTNLFGRGFESDRDRIGGYKDYRTIDANVPEMSRALSIIATNATSGDQLSERGFQLEFAPDLPEQDREIINDLVFKRLRLDETIRPILRNSNKFGDEFEMPIFDKNGVILRLRNLEPELTMRFHDDFDRLQGFAYKGFKSKDRFLKWWEVIHLKHDPERGDRYGRSLFAGGGRTLAHRVLTIRDALTFETLIHSTARNAIFLPRPHAMPELKRRDWIRKMRENFNREEVVDSSGLLSRRAISLLNSQHIVVDFPTDAQGNGAKPMIQPLQNAPLEKNIKVCEHFQDLLFVLTGVPKSFMGIDRTGDGLGSQRLDRQDLQFARQLNGEQLDGCWFVMEVIRRQYILLGRPLPEGAVKVIFPDLREFDAKLNAEINNTRMSAAKTAADAGLPFSYIWTEILWDGDQQVAEEKADLYNVDLDQDPLGDIARGRKANVAATESMHEQVRNLRSMLKTVRGAVVENEAVDESHMLEEPARGKILKNGVE